MSVSKSRDDRSAESAQMCSTELAILQALVESDFAVAGE